MAEFMALLGVPLCFFQNVIHMFRESLIVTHVLVLICSLPICGSTRLRKHSRDVVEAFRDDMLALPEVVDIYLVAGAHDFLLHLVVPDSDHLRNLALDKITIRPEVVHLETSLIFEHSRDHVTPSF